MSVIGRLDNQVDEILISPLRRRGNREADEAREEEEMPRAKEQSDPAPLKKNPDTGQLPVWLL